VGEVLWWNATSQVGGLQNAKVRNWSRSVQRSSDAAVVECQSLEKISNFLEQWRRQLLQCTSPLLAQSGHSVPDIAVPHHMHSVSSSMLGRLIDLPAE
jgi:hypothetical protein